MKHALVVDDNEVNRILATKLLKKVGWTVDEAECGEAALAYLEGRTVELVLLDVSMPTLSGQDVCRRIRQGKLGGAAVKVVAYTAHAMPEEVSSLLTGGFDLVLSKPISRDRLSQTLSQLGFS